MKDSNVLDFFLMMTLMGLNWRIKFCDVRTCSSGSILIQQKHRCRSVGMEIRGSNVFAFQAMARPKLPETKHSSLACGVSDDFRRP